MDRIVEASPTQTHRAKGPKQQFKAMFSPPLRKYTILYLTIWFGAGFTFTGIASFIPALLNRAQSGLSDGDVYAIMLGQQLTGFLGVYLATKLVNSSFGRKKTLFTGLFFGVILVFGFIFINFYAVFFM